MPLRSIFTTTLTISALLAAPTWAAPVPAQPTFQPLGWVQPIMGQAATDEVLEVLRDAASDCGQLPAEYRVDCLRQGLRAARGKIQRRPDYSVASKELNNAAKALDKLVKANVDRAAPAIRVAGKKVRAVKKAAVPKVNKAARAVVTESATRLLRSGGSAERQAQVVQIARAVESTKVILRS